VRTRRELGKLDPADDLDAAGNFSWVHSISRHVGYPGVLFCYSNDGKERLDCILIRAPQASHIEKHPTGTWLALLKSVPKIDVAA